MGGVVVLKENKWLNFSSDADHHADCRTGNPAITQQTTQTVMKFPG